MQRLTTLILVVIVMLAVSCIGGKRGPRGTNVGTGSDEGGPWSSGGPAARPTPP